MSWPYDLTEDLDLNELAASVTVREIDEPAAPDDLVVYEATYHEPYETPTHIGLFRTEDAARQACANYFAKLSTWRKAKHLKIFTRLLSA